MKTFLGHVIDFLEQFQGRKQYTIDGKMFSAQTVIQLIDYFKRENKKLAFKEVDQVSVTLIASFLGNCHYTYIGLLLNDGREELVNVSYPSHYRVKTETGKDRIVYCDFLTVITDKVMKGNTN